jgi:hypothetical protein
MQNFYGKISRQMQYFYGKISRQVQDFYGKISRQMQYFYGKIFRQMQDFCGKISRQMQNFYCKRRYGVFRETKETLCVEYIFICLCVIFRRTECLYTPALHRPLHI